MTDAEGVVNQLRSVDALLGWAQTEMEREQAATATVYAQMATARAIAALAEAVAAGLD